MTKKIAKTLLLSAMMLILSNLCPAQSTKKPILLEEPTQPTQPARPRQPRQEPVPPREPVKEPVQTRPHAAEPEMVFVQGGTFTMGCTSEQGSDCNANEKPAHQVTVSSFNIAKYPVTQGQWKAIMGTTVREQRDMLNPSFSIVGEGDNYPMYFISWEEAQEFISRLNAATGKKYRLPTEAEWEFAARGGTKSGGYKYSGSNIVNDVAWYYISGDNTHPVGTKMPNELGICDMSGNIWEWCSDWFGDYSATAKHNPTGPSTGSTRVFRGGSWNENASDCRITIRDSRSPRSASSARGFRLVLP